MHFLHNHFVVFVIFVGLKNAPTSFFRETVHVLTQTGVCFFVVDLTSYMFNQVNTEYFETKHSLIIRMSSVYVKKHN